MERKKKDVYRREKLDREEKARYSKKKDKRGEEEAETEREV